jgi:hypothetical protein
VPDYPAIHAPYRPEWLCLACGADWPCPTRKRQLCELFAGEPGGIVRYLASYLVDANTDLGHLSTIEVTDRFVGWCDKPGR